MSSTLPTRTPSKQKNVDASVNAYSSMRSSASASSGQPPAAPSANSENAIRHGEKKSTWMASPRRENLTAMLNIIQESFLLAAFGRIGLCDENCYFDHWVKVLGRFGVSRKQIEELFEEVYIGVDPATGAVNAEEVATALVTHPVVSVAAPYTKSLTSIGFLQLKFRLLLAGCRAVDVPFDCKLSSNDLCGVMERLGVEMEFLGCQQVLHVLLGRQHIADSKFISVPVLCHQLAIEGTPVPAVQSRTLILVKHRLLEAIFMTVDHDRSLSMNKSELSDILGRWGVSPEDTSEIFDALVGEPQDTEGENKPQTLTSPQFCKVMALDDGGLRYHMKKKAAKGAITIGRCRRRLLSAALKHLDVNENNELDFDEWRDALESLGIPRDSSGDVFVLFDVNHDLTLSLQEVEQILIGNLSNSAETSITDADLDQTLGISAEFNGSELEGRYESWLSHSRSNLAIEKKMSFSDRFLQALNSRQFDMLIGCLIFVNAIVIGFEANASMAGKSGAFGYFQHTFTIIFFCEAAAQIWAQRLHYFKDMFNCFDVFIVALGIVDGLLALLLAIGRSSSSGGNLRSVSVLRLVRICRVVRVVRVLRIVKIFRELRILTTGLVGGMRTLTWTMVLLVLLLYCCSVFVCMMLAPAEGFTGNARPPTGCNDPLDSTQCFVHIYFGSVQTSMFSMFQIMTLDDWSPIIRPMERFRPGMWVFFIGFICFSTFVILNLVTGVFLDQCLEIAREDKRGDVERLRKLRLERIQKLAELFEDADVDGSNTLTVSEFKELVQDQNVEELFISVGFTSSELDGLFNLLDSSGEGAVDLEEFTGGMIKLQRSVKIADLIEAQQQQFEITRKLSSLKMKLCGIEDLLHTGTGKKNSMLSKSFSAIPEEEVYSKAVDGWEEFDTEVTSPVKSGQNTVLRFPGVPKLEWMPGPSSSVNSGTTSIQTSMPSSARGQALYATLESKIGALQGSIQEKLHGNVQHITAATEGLKEKIAQATAGFDELEAALRTNRTVHEDVKWI